MNTENTTVKTAIGIEIERKEKEKTGFELSLKGEQIWPPKMFVIKRDVSYDIEVPVQITTKA